MSNGIHIPKYYVVPSAMVVNQHLYHSIEQRENVYDVRKILRNNVLWRNALTGAVCNASGLESLMH